MQTAGSPGHGDSDWAYLSRELRRRSTEPFKHVPFVFYLVVAVIVFGGLGIWVELVKLLLASPPAAQPSAMPGATLAPAGPDISSLITALVTYFPALIGSAALQFSLALIKRTDKTLISFALFILVTSSAAAILLSIFSAAHSGGVLCLGVLLCIGAVWVWVIANADDDTFRRVPSKVDAASGGDPDRELPGSLSGYQA